LNERIDSGCRSSAEICLAFRRQYACYMLTTCKGLLSSVIVAGAS
jgi:hypothetical protein